MSIPVHPGLNAANASWFDFRVLSGDFSQFTAFSVYAFTGQEAVCKPYEFSIELVSPLGAVQDTRLLGASACLSILDRSGKKRLVHGLINAMDQLHKGNHYTHYRCGLVPRLWFLGQIRDHRIFQHLSVVDIIQQILQEQGHAAETFVFKLCYRYEPREYCVQYGESDLHFITRLCEEEGIYFYFEHTATTHCLCFSDREGGPRISGNHDLRFFAGSGQAADTAVINRLCLRHRVNPNAVAYREWNFEHPRLRYECTTAEPEHDKAPTPPGMRLEQYRFPHLYQDQDPGKRYANLQLLRQLSFLRVIEAETDVSRHLPGATFKIHGHPNAIVNACWWAVSVRHEGEQPGVLEHEAPSDRGLRYQALVTAIPEMTRFVPEIDHPKKRVEGLQSALVTGPENEEVHTDQYGRVKVQFHWDREGKLDENTTCWVRVADTWAGKDFGFIQVPRIGQEVMVEYMEGDPDRPVITGRVYKTRTMPPWELPREKTLSGIQSREFKGAGRNQLVMDDTQGRIQAQLSSDHDLSQLNLGHLNRINHHEGRKDFRGEGFELRTDGWGSVRAGKGLVISTDARDRAKEHHKDIKEAVATLEAAASQHKSQLGQAVHHQAQDAGDETALTDVQAKQNSELRGNGQPHGEFTAPQLLVSSPAGIAATTPESTHLHSGRHTSATAGGHTSLASGKSLLVTAMDKVSLFARNLGMKFYAGSGKVEIQAQSDALDIIAQKIVELVSVDELIRISSPKEILLTAGESFIKIGTSGIEQGTNGKIVIHAAKREMVGAKTAPFLSPVLPHGAYDQHFVCIDKKTGKPTTDFEYLMETPNGEVTGALCEKGKTAFYFSNIEQEPFTLLSLVQHQIGVEK